MDLSSGRSASSQLSPIASSVGMSLLKISLSFCPPHIFGLNMGSNFNGYKFIVWYFNSFSALGL